MASPGADRRVSSRLCTIEYWWAGKHKLRQTSSSGPAGSGARSFTLRVVAIGSLISCDQSLPNGNRAHPSYRQDRLGSGTYHPPFLSSTAFSEHDPGHRVDGRKQAQGCLSRIPQRPNFFPGAGIMAPLVIGEFVKDWEKRRCIDTDRLSSDCACVRRALQATIQEER
jgi:hypothetical protein